MGLTVKKGKGGRRCWDVVKARYRETRRFLVFSSWGGCMRERWEAVVGQQSQPWGCPEATAVGEGPRWRKTAGAATARHARGKRRVARAAF